MTFSFRFFFKAFVAALLLMSFYRVHGQSNDHMFPAAKVAKPFIDFDSHGFMVNGKRTYLVSAGVEYARIPRALWRERLLKLKRAGFNCIEIYTFWNYHEPIEGRFDFSGEKDLDAFLKLIHELGMYSIPRVGPYYCAEWDFGGYPVWLRQKKGMIARTADTAFVKYTDRFFDRLLPIVVNNQINKGGSVIMVQLENEHPAAWGTYIANPYFQYLVDKAVKMGVVVPYFLSGMHHGHDPAEDTKDLFDSKRPSPWFSTEFWVDWFDKYGSGEKEAVDFARRTWKIVSRGGNGYNFYMAHGGSNFGYTNDDEDAASYDYGAALGQTGDLRPMYYAFKRIGYFARSFEDILENSNASDSKRLTVINDSINQNTRTSASGDIVFLDNKTGLEQRTKLNIGGQLFPSSGELVVDSLEIMPLVHHFSLSPNVSLQWAIARIFGIQRYGNTTSVFVYGQPKSGGDLVFSLKQNHKLLQGGSSFSAKANTLNLKLNFDSSMPQVYRFLVGGDTVKIIALNKNLANHTWFVDDYKEPFCIVGPQYVGDVTFSKGEIKFHTERYWSRPGTDSQYWILKADKDVAVPVPSTANTSRIREIKFNSDWIVKDGAAPATTNFGRKHWLGSVLPQQMGADGDTTAYVWYNTQVNVPESFDYTLYFDKGNGRYIVYLDGKKVDVFNSPRFRLFIPKGVHELSIFATHDGRNKLVSYVGNLEIDEKGVAGKAMLQKGELQTIREWKMMPVDGKDITGQSIPDFKNATRYFSGADAFNGKKAFAWFQAEVNAGNNFPDSLYFKEIDDNAVVYINGVYAGKQNGWGIPFTVPVPPTSAGKGMLTVTVLVENKDGRGGIGSDIKLLYKSDIELKGWKMKGGLEYLKAGNDWKPVDQPSAGPVLYRNTFRVNKTGSASHPVWRVTFEGVSHGFIWVNGYNLGRYPERIPIDGLYIPECWLNQHGDNEILIFDEYGHTPAKVKIVAEEIASRDDIYVSAKK